MNPIVKPITVENIPYPLPGLKEIKAISTSLSPYVRRTPMIEMPIAKMDDITLYAKMEIWQKTHSFKIRGALNSLRNLSDDALKKGVITASAGNHGIALSYACTIIPTSLKLLMPASADPYKIKTCQSYGTDVVLTDNIAEIFTQLSALQAKENRTLIHPFEGVNITAGTATLGLEISEQCQGLDALVVAIGGGGLISGVAYAMKLAHPNCAVYGVEPEGADSMRKSFSKGKPCSVNPDTISQSLAAPHSLPFSYSVCTHFVDGIVRVSDEDTVRAMRYLHEQFHLTLEPAAAISLAAILGPLNTTLKHKKVGMILCGSNMSLNAFNDYLNMDTHSA